MQIEERKEFLNLETFDEDTYSDDDEVIGLEKEHKNQIEEILNHEDIDSLVKRIVSDVNFLEVVK